MAEYIIDKGVSPEVWADIEKLAKALGNMPNVSIGANGSNAQSTSAINAQTEAISKRIKLTMEERVAQQALNQQQKLAATVTSEQTTSLQKLFAQMKLLEIEMQSKFNPALKEQGKEFTNLSAQHAKLQAEYQRTARATGVMGRTMNSAYGSTFQLTQVMRELPNFAISARIGFMSLSNNLPMLIDSFKILKQQIIDTEGAAGATKKTFAAFGKSLLSLNTIMIVASTVLVMYGEDIWNFTVRLIKGDEAVNRLRESTKSLIMVMQDYSGQAASSIGNIQKMGVELEKYGGDAEFTKIIIDNFNSTFKTHLKSIDEVKKAYPEMAKAAIDAAVKLQASARIIDMGARGTLMTMEGESGLSRHSKKRVDEQRQMYNLLITTATKFNFDMNKLTTSITGGETPFELEKAFATGSDNDIVKLRMFYKNANNLWYAQQFAKITKGRSLTKLAEQELSPLLTDPKAIKEPNKPKATSNQKEQKTGSMTNVDLRAYDEERLAIQKKLAQNEMDMQELSANGEVNSYEKRTQAAIDYLNNKIYLNQLEQENQEVNLYNKYVNDKKELDDKKKKNDLDYSQKEISDARKLELDAEYEESVKNLTLNFEADKKKIQFDAQKDEQDALMQQKNNLLKITDDYYKELQRLENINVSKQNSQADVKNRENKKQSGFRSFVGGLVGFNNSTGEKMSDTQTEIQKIDNEIASQNRLLENTRLTEEQKNKIKEKIANLNEQRLDKQLELEKTIEDRRSELIQNTESKIMDFLKEAWGQFFEYLNKQLEKESEKQTKIEDERYKDIEDREAAGVITKQQAEEEKLRTSAYYASIQEELDRKKEENDKNKFLLEQAGALAKVWINFALAESSLENLLALGTLTPLYLAVAGASTALIAAQSIPYFAEGGIMDHNGLAVMGDAHKKELAISPSGKFFISNDTPTMYNLEKGTQILPDVNKLDLMSILALKQVMPQNNSTNDGKLMRELINTVKSQKSGNFYGMPLIKQLDNRSRYSSRNKSLMN